MKNPEYQDKSSESGTNINTIWYNYTQWFTTA